MGTLSGKVALVVRPDLPIGQAAAERLSAEGARLVAVGPKSDALTADLILDFDLTSQQSWRTGLDQVCSGFGPIDCAVICTETQPAAHIGEGSFTAFRDRHRSVAVAGWLAQTECILAMRRAGRAGSIVHVLPMASKIGMAGEAADCAAAGGLLFSSKSAALECARAKDGIVVNAVIAGVPAPPEAVTDAVMFYLTDGAAYMTGTELPVDDGRLAGGAG